MFGSGDCYGLLLAAYPLAGSLPLWQVVHFCVASTIQHTKGHVHIDIGGNVLQALG